MEKYKKSIILFFIRALVFFPSSLVLGHFKKGIIKEKELSIYPSSLFSSSGSKRDFISGASECISRFPLSMCKRSDVFPPERGLGLSSTLLLPNLSRKATAHWNNTLLC